MGGQCPGIILKILVNAQVSSGDVVPRNERFLPVDDFINTIVCMILSLDAVEDNERTVGSTTAVNDYERLSLDIEM